MPSSPTPHLFDLTRIGAGLPAAGLIDRLTGAEVGDFPRLVVQAPPGTGKTTLVPPLDAEHLAVCGDQAGRISGGQPRRRAARAAGGRLAERAGTRLGEVVGFTIRGQARSSARTRIEFVTTGVLLARLLRDPGLAGVRAVVLDEVHERQLDTDLAVAMCRELSDLRSEPSRVGVA